MVDNNAKPGSYILTGSQSFSLMNLVEESLAGRAAILNLPTISNSEINGNAPGMFIPTLDNLKIRCKLQKKYDINELYKKIWLGSMPSLVSGKYSSKKIYYSSYFQSYIARDIREQISIKDEYKYIDFIRAASCRVACELNIHSIALDVDISDDTAKRWLRLLEKS